MQILCLYKGIKSTSKSSIKSPSYFTSNWAVASLSLDIFGTLLLSISPENSQNII